MNKASKNQKERLKIFKGITVTCSTMIEPQINKVSNMISDMGGKFHTDFPKNTNVVVIDIPNLAGYESIMKSMKYKYVVEKKLDTILIDLETLKHIHSLYIANDIYKIHPILTAGGNANSIKNDEFLKHILLNLLRVKYSVKPFDLLKNKVKVFFGKYKHQDDINDCIGSIKQNISDKNFLNLDIQASCYMTQLNDEARDTCLFITELNYGARLDAAKKDRIPVIHVQWIKDILDRNMMLSYKPYLLNDITIKSTPEINDRMAGNRTWKNSDLEIIQKDVELAKQIFDEYEVIDNKIIIKKNLKSKLDNSIWDKIVNNDNGSNTKLSDLADLTKSTEQDNSIINIETTTREISILPPENQQDYFKSYHIMTFGFSGKHNKILERTFKKSECESFKPYYDEETSINGIDCLKPDFLELEFDFSRGKKCLFVIPYNYDLSKLPSFLVEKYLETLEYLQDGKFDWNQAPVYVVTEFYLERCLFYKKITKPNAWAIPFYNSELSLEHYKNISEKKDTYNWTTTGFEGVELLHLNKIINMFNTLKDQTNFVFSQNLNSNTDLLVVNLSKLMAMKATKKGPLYDENNKYTSLFKEEEMFLSEQRSQGNDVIDPNNFLLKKLTFIKNSKNQIASVTPGFLFELFHQFNVVKLGKLYDITVKQLEVNDKNWCITCPQTSKMYISEASNHKRGLSHDSHERYVFKIKTIHFDGNITTENKKRKLDNQVIPDLNPKKLNSSGFNRPESLDISPTNWSNQSSPEKDKVSDKWRAKFLNSGTSPLKRKNETLESSPLKEPKGNNILHDNDTSGRNSPKRTTLFTSDNPPSQITYGFGKSDNTAVESHSGRTSRRITRQLTKQFASTNNIDI